MATSSDLISTIDRITNQVTDIEKDFESKLDKLEIENSNLRNQIVSLKQRLNSEILDNKSIEAELVKPETDSLIPSTIFSEATELIEVVEPQSESSVHKIVLKEFNNDIYTEGVIFYNNEQYDKCIESLSSLPLNQKEIRNTSKALFFLADSYEKVGLYKRALSCLESLSSFNDDNYSELILFKKGIIYRDIGMSDKAQRVFQTLVDFYPESEFKIFAEQEIQNI
jgi:tetratricopeptide (TPR) repeat protein